MGFKKVILTSAIAPNDIEIYRCYSILCRNILMRYLRFWRIYVLYVCYTHEIKLQIYQNGSLISLYNIIPGLNEVTHTIVLFSLLSFPAIDVYILYVLYI